jgi:hypothetical protein
MAAVVERGGSFERSDSASPPAMRIDIKADGKGFSGTLEARTPEGESATRRVRGDNCAEVVDGLAVVTSIALREDTSEPPSPRAGSGEAPGDKGDTAGPTDTTPPPPAVPAAPATNRVAPRQDSRLRTIGVWDDKKSIPVSAGELGVNRAFAVTLSGGAVFGAIPDLIMPRYDLTFSAASFITTPSAEKYLIGGIPRVRFTYFGKSTLRSGGFETSIVGFKTGVGTCTSILHDLEGLVLLACTDFSIGVMQVETKDATGTVTQSKSVGQGTAGIELAARYNFSRLFHASFTIGGEAWMSKLSAERPDGSNIFDSRLLSGNAELGLGINF